MLPCAMTFLIPFRATILALAMGSIMSSVANLSRSLQAHGGQEVGGTNKREKRSTHEEPMHCCYLNIKSIWDLMHSSLKQTVS